MAKGVIKKIFSEHWDEFLNRFGHKVRPVVIKEIKKILGCGSFANGYAEYQCEKCGEKKKVPFRCRSRLCGTCGKVYIDNRAENMSEKLIRCKHRHMVFTIAEELPERVVVHKRTRFTNEEITGLTQSLKYSGIENVDLVEITYEDNARFIAVKDNFIIDNYPLARGFFKTRNG